MAEEEKEPAEESAETLEETETEAAATDTSSEAETEAEASEAAEQPEAAPKKKKTAMIVAIVAVVAALIGGGAYWYVNYQVPHQKAVEAFNTACDGLEARNAEVDEAIAAIQAVQAGEDKPLDEATDTAASNAIGQAQAAKESAPEMPSGTDEINAAAADVDKMGDYTGALASLAAAQKALEDSIAQLKQVTNPTEAFVIGRITGLPNITGAEAVTETNDPNGKLGKAGGYTATVYFSSDLVDQSSVSALDGYTGIVAVGNDGGGTVEVYSTAEDAEKRNTYLGAFDGSVFASGSHEVVGTCLLRTSDKLTASQQQALTQEVKDALIRLD